MMTIYITRQTHSYCSNVSGFLVHLSTQKRARTEIVDQLYLIGELGENQRLKYPHLLTYSW